MAVKQDDVDAKTLTPEQVAKKLLERLGVLDELVGGQKSLREEVDDIKRKTAVLEGLDAGDITFKNVLGEFEKLKAGQEKFVEAMRRGNPLTRIPGMGEDSVGKFSIIRAICGARSGEWEKNGAGYEKEVMEAYAQKLGQISGVHSSGGAFIPDEVIADVIVAIYTKSAFISLDENGETRISILDGLVGGRATIPKWLGGVIAYWIGEEDAYVQSMAKVGDITMTPKKLGVLVKMTEEMRRAQGFGFENMLRADMVKAAAKKLDWTAVFGNGSNNMPIGILGKVNQAQLATFNTARATNLQDAINNLDSVRVFRAETGLEWDGADIAAAAGGELNLDGLDEIRGMLSDVDIDVDDGYATVSTDRYFRRIKRIKVDAYSGQTTNRAYLIGPARIQDSQLEELIGPFGRTTQMADANVPGESLASKGWSTSVTDENYGDVIAGNLREMVLGRWGGTEIDTDEGKGVGFTSDVTYTKLRLWVDYAYRHPQSIVVCPDAQIRG